MTSNPYRVSEEALNDLHSRLCAGLEECPPVSVVQRSNREVSALWNSPCTYALLIADDVIKTLRRKGIHAQLSGKWENSLCAYQMGLIPENGLLYAEDLSHRICSFFLSGGSDMCVCV